MADYTPTFDPRLSGLAPGDLLAAAKDQQFQAYKCNLVGYLRAVCACEKKAAMYELEAEERWLVHAAEVRVHIRPDGGVTALGAADAFRSFVGAGR